MQHQSSLADLLKLLLCLDDECPVYATPSFAAWLRPDESAAWPPPEDADKGLLLVDTRDRVARRDQVAWGGGSGNTGADAALILAGTGQGGSFVRRLIRRLGRPGARRLSETRVSRILQGVSDAGSLQRLAFVDRGGVPTGFEVDGPARSSGAAFMVTGRALFEGPLWSLIADRLGERDVRTHAFHLRARGAAVVLMRAHDREFVVRVVPDGPLQDVVLKNHSALIELRGKLEGHDALVRLMPTPLFGERQDSLLLLGETGRPGTLAWKVASGARAPIIHRHALTFLDGLRTATLSAIPAERVSELLHDDQVRVDNSPFVSDNVKRLIRQELSAAADVLAEREIMAYTSHGDFGYGNLLVDPGSGRLEGVIDWDTATFVDLPGIDRVNMEIQILRGRGLSFAHAVDLVWLRRSAHDALEGGADPARSRALFGAAVCRYVTRAFSYPALYRAMAGEYERALSWLARIGRDRAAQLA